MSDSTTSLFNNTAPASSPTWENIDNAVTQAESARDQAVASAADASSSATSAASSASAAAAGVASVAGADAAVAASASAAATSASQAATSATNAAASATSAATSASSVSSRATDAANSATAAAASATSANASASSATASAAAAAASAAQASSPVTATPFAAPGGTAQRTVVDRAGDTLNVKDFGAKLDGTTDDSAAFQAAYSAAKPGQTIYVPKGGLKLNTAPTGAAGPVVWKLDGTTSGTGTSQVNYVTADDISEWTVSGRKAFWKTTTNAAGKYATFEVNTTYNVTPGVHGAIPSGLRSSVTIGAINTADSPTALVGSVTTSNTGTGQAQAVGAFATRQTAQPANSIWSFWSICQDNTGLASSAAGGLNGIEVDVFANGADDGGGSSGGISPWGTRVLGLFVYNKSNPTGTAVGVGHGILVGPQNGDNTVGSIGIGYGLQGPFSGSAYDTRLAVQGAGANAIWLGDGHTIALDKAGAHTLDGTGGSINYKVSGSTVLQVAANGHLGVGVGAQNGVGVDVGGSTSCGFRTTQATLTGAAFRMAAGQFIGLDSSDTHRLTYVAGTPNKLIYSVGGVNVWSVDDAGNVICKGTLTQNGTP